jgi:Tol biopolymer transport system component
MVVHHAPVSDGREWIVFMRDRALLAQRIARDGSRLIGEPVAMAEVPDRRGDAADPIVKVGGGTLVYDPLETRPVEIAWYSRQGLKLGRVGGEPFVIAPEVSPDGNHAVMRGVQGGETWLVSVDLTTGAVQRLTSMEAWNSWPIWDVASREILYAASLSDGGTAVMAMQPDLPDAPRIVAQRPYYIRPEFDAGSTGLIANQTAPNGRTDITLLNHNSGEVVRSLVGTPAEDIGGVVFAGGRALAYVSNSSGRYEIYATDLASPGRPVRLSSHGCSPSLRMFRRPVWAVGDELIYCSADGQTLRSLRATLDGGQWRVGEDRALFTLPQGLRGLCPTPDGSRFLLLTSEGNQSPSTVTIVQGWHRELEKH